MELLQENIKDNRCSVSRRDQPEQELHRGAAAAAVFGGAIDRPVEGAECGPLMKGKKTLRATGGCRSESVGRNKYQINSLQPSLLRLPVRRSDNTLTCRHPPPRLHPSIPPPFHPSIPPPPAYPLPLFPLLPFLPLLLLQLMQATSRAAVDTFQQQKQQAGRLNCRGRL